MGVYKLFPSLTKRYENKKIIFTKKEALESTNPDLNLILCVDELYIDTNCLLHPKCFEIADKHKSLLKTNPDKLEKLMIINCIEYIEELIKLVNPSKRVFIAIDGVAPVAKNKQQHSRRYKTIFDNRQKKKMSAKYGIEYQNSWNNSAITPGTIFMHKITLGIVNYLKAKQLNSTSHKVEYIFSSAYTPGEGEHKILQEIKNKQNCVRIIYGLDSDLINLALASQANNIFLLREVTEFQNIDPVEMFCYMSIDMLRSGIYEDIISELSHDIQFPNMNLYINNIIRDYVQLGVMLGNDFLSHLPSVNLKYNKEYLGLNILISAWTNTFTTINENRKTDYIFMLNDNLQYNYHFFVELFSDLATREESYFVNTRKFRKKYKKYEPSTFEEELEIWENLQFHIPDVLQLGSVSFPIAKSNFYTYYNMKNKNEAINEYLKGLCWNAHYYFNNCPDYFWYYPYAKTPFVTDIYEWLLSNEDKFTEITHYYNIHEESRNKNCVYPLEQLVLVLPPQSSYLLPKTYKKVVLENEEIFPKKFEVDLQDIGKMYQAHPKIKLPLITDIKMLLFGKTLTTEEQKRNSFKKVMRIII